MEATIKTTDELNEEIIMETLLSYIDKGIDDMEQGRMDTIDEAFQIIRERFGMQTIKAN